MLAKLREPSVESERSDEDLIGGIRRGSMSAFDCLMLRYWVSLLRFSEAMLGSADEAEDMVQRAFIQLWERRADWREGGSVRAYLYKVTRNLSLNERRRRTIREQLFQQRRRTQLNNPASPGQVLAAAELQSAVDRTLAGMPTRRREVFELVRFQGLSYREAGEVLGISSRTVANHMSAALADFRDSLRDFM
jgi:RNA polymerase sigma-70 factor, ECF subfamily